MRYLIILILCSTCFGWTPAINSFTTGQVSPLMEARNDFQKYKSSCRTIENMVVETQGPVTRRPGTKYIAKADDSNHVRLIPFEYSTDDTYILEMGNLYARFYRSGGQIAISESDANAYEITTTYGTDGLFDIHYAQVDNVMYMVDGDNPPQKLQRFGHAEWSIDDIEFSTMPFMEKFNNGISITPSGTSGTITLTASAPLFWPDPNYREAKVYSGTLYHEGNSPNFNVYAGQSYYVSATESAYHVLSSATMTWQKSTDNGATWATVKSGASRTIEANDVQDVDALFRFHLDTTGLSRLARAYYYLKTNAYSPVDTSYLYVGSYWQINQKALQTALTGSLASDANSGAMYVQGGYSFTTSGAWDATVTLQRSTDGGSTWTAALTPLYAANFSNPSEYESEGALYRILMEDRTSGTCKYGLTTQDQMNHGVVKITAVSNSVTATALVLKALVDTNSTTDWREGYWSDYRGWPKNVAIHQDRLVFGGSQTFPQTLWFAKASPDDRENFTEGTLDTDAFTVALPGQNPIQWLLSGDYLFIGTSGSVGKYGEQGKPITPTTPNYQEQSKAGSANIKGILAGDTILYVERGGQKVREFAYNLQMDKYLSPDLTILAENITESGIKDMAFMARPQPSLWCVLNDGNMAVLTYQRDHEVVGWSKQHTTGDIGSVAVIPGSQEHELWVSVKRNIDSNDYYYVEQMQPFKWGSDANDCWFVDSGLDWNGSEANSFSGLTHLIGETLCAYGDGLILPDVTVDANGEITTGATQVKRLTVGLPYTSKLETLPIQFDLDTGSIAPANKKISSIDFDLYKTGYMKYGNGSSSTLTNINFANDLNADPNATVQELYTSTVTLKHVLFPYGSRKKQTVYVESSEPMPLCIRAIIPNMEIIR